MNLAKISVKGPRRTEENRGEPRKVRGRTEENRGEPRNRKFHVLANNPKVMPQTFKTSKNKSKLRFCV